MARGMHESATEVFRAVVSVTFPDGSTGTFCAGPFEKRGPATKALRRELRYWEVHGTAASGRIERAETLWEVVE